MPIQILVLFIALLLLSKSILLASIFAVPLAFILNSFNITDGMDGLAAGIAIPSFLLFTYLEYTQYGESSIFFLILLLLTFLITFFIFNIKPAKVFLGDSGSYAIGGVLALLTIRYNLLFTIPVIAIFLVEGISSFIQIVSIKVLKKKFFKIAPLHLHLLNSGWSPWRVILAAWIIQIVITTLIYVIYSYVG
jgi:phospho-N-acetylmuramoyl-pentapeptide-transferase